MQDFEINNDMLLNPLDVVVPKGWTVLSHGTSFPKWNNPLPGIPAQDLKKSKHVVIHNTVNGGLTCFDEQNRQMPAVYAGQDEPVILRVLVPGDPKAFDAQTAEEALRLIKPPHLEEGVGLLPENTVLVKLGEEISERPGDVSVIWFVPEQFSPFLRQDLLKFNSRKEKTATLGDDEVGAEFDINSSFAAAQDTDTEEHILDQEEKADEYYEDLKEQQQDLLDEEIAAEEKLEQKRARDKKRAREQDKKNIAAAEKEHQKQMAEANASVERADNFSAGQSPAVSDNAPYGFETIKSESYAFVSINEINSAFGSTGNEEPSVASAPTKSSQEDFAPDYGANTFKQNPQKITSEEFKKYEENFYATREKFRSYTGDIPKDVEREYAVASERYFSTQRKLEEGTAVIDDSYSQVSQTPSYSTVQNYTAGADAPGRRESTSFKDPPKSPVDGGTLTFGTDKFHAIRRYGHTVSGGVRQAGSTVTNQIVQTATTEESGTAQTMYKFSQGISEAKIVFDCVSGGPDKKGAAKIWSKYVADANGTKYYGIDHLAIHNYGKLNTKTVENKLKESLTEKELNILHTKFGKEADVGIAAAVGTHNGRIGKVPAFVDGKVNVSIVEGQIGALRNQSTNLKSQITELYSKGSALTVDERQRLSFLLEKKKGTDERLRNMIGATNSRHASERFYRKVNTLSPRQLEKEINKLEKKIAKGLQLTKSQTKLLTAMKERLANFKMSEKLSGSRFFSRAARLGSVASRHAGRLLKDSGDETLATMSSVGDRFASASRFATNRYVRGALKWGVKGAKASARQAKKLLRKVDRKLGASKAVKKAVSKPINKAASRLLRKRPIKKVVRLHKSIKRNVAAKRAAKAAATAAKKAAKKTVAKAVRKAFEKAAQAAAKVAAKMGMEAAVTAVGKVASYWVPYLGQALLIIDIVKICIAAAIAIAIILALAIWAGAAVLMGLPAGTFAGEGSADGRIDVAPYVQVLNTEQEKINDIVFEHKNNTEARGGKYKQVYVNYLGGANSNNYREILSMTAVYFKQDFSNKDAVSKYMVNLYNASNYVLTEESETYYCSGCEERTYKCTDAPDEYATTDRKNWYNLYSRRGGCTEYEAPCPEGGQCQKSYCVYNANHTMSSIGNCDNYKLCVIDGKVYYQCLGHAYCPGRHIRYKCDGAHVEKICKGHIDLYVNVVCLGFDKLFAADPGSSVGLNLGNYKQGDLIGTFKITYYCAEKYPHICNAGPPYKTASGTTVTPGRTIAVDSSVIPLGTAVVINGHTYIAEDTGGAIKGNRIDIAVETHQEALNAGTDVFMVYAAEAISEEEKTETVERAVQEYLRLANEAHTETFSVRHALEVFGRAKEPKIDWHVDRVNRDNENSFVAKLQNHDEKHKNEPFTNAELNAFEYIKMSDDEIKNLCWRRGLSADGSKYSLIMNQLLPYDKKHPDKYIVPPSKNNNQGFYFEGWNDDNKEWAKTILSNMTDDVYAGLEDIGPSPGTIFGSTSLDGVIIKGSKIDVTYYSQHDPRWANIPIRPDDPYNNISEAGCGFTSMAIVVSSLTENQMDPVAMCSRYGTTYYLPNQGALWAIVSGVSEDYGLTCTEMSIYTQNVINALNEGKLVVALVGNGGLGYTGSGYYRGGGHFLVICGVTSDGKFLLADPNNAAVSTSGTGVDMQYFLDSGIKTWWAVGKN